MIIEFKLFERKVLLASNKTNHKPFKYKVGDYINFKNKICKILDRYNDTSNINNYKILSLEKEISEWIYQSEINPLTEKQLKELELINSMNKYNL